MGEKRSLPGCSADSRGDFDHAFGVALVDCFRELLVERDEVPPAKSRVEPYDSFVCIGGHRECLAIQVGHRQLEHGCKRDPQEVWDLDIGNPSCVWVDGDDGPDEGHKDKDDVDRCEHVALEAKL